MRLRYTARALRHLQGISDFIGTRNPAAAHRVGERIRETIELLAKFPDLGHEGALSGTRELIVPGLPCIVVHRVDTDDGGNLTVLGIYHGAQLRPGQSAPEGQ